MANQFAVVYHPDYSLVVNAVGPFRSEAAAERAAQRINDASEWTSDLEDAPTTIAEVVRFISLADALAAVSEPSDS